MNGQMKKSKREVVDEYITRVNPYEKPRPITYDLRGYAAFVAEKGLKATDITPEIMKKIFPSNSIRRGKLCAR